MQPVVRGIGMGELLNTTSEPQWSQYLNREDAYAACVRLPALETLVETLDVILKGKRPRRMGRVARVGQEPSSSYTAVVVLWFVIN